MIDLHTHTTASDGTFTPAELIDAAAELRLEALAITDHDTLAGFDESAPLARDRNLDLVCGIELGTRLATERGGSKPVHMLGYFIAGPPSPSFREWLAELRESRRARNIHLVERLRTMDVDITLAEVESLGRSIAGRPHFARILIQKGYVKSMEQAFREYIGENAPGYVERDSPTVASAASLLVAGGGIPVLAHPVRLGLRNHDDEAATIEQLRDAGVLGIEVYHSDHSASDVNRYLSLARKLDMMITGGSDFHGGNKLRVSLGTGCNGNVHVPREVLDRLRSQAAAKLS